MHYTIHNSFAILSRKNAHEQTTLIRNRQIIRSGLFKSPPGKLARKPKTMLRCVRKKDHSALRARVAATSIALSHHLENLCTSYRLSGIACSSAGSTRRSSLPSAETPRATGVLASIIAPLMLGRFVVVDVTLEIPRTYIASPQVRDG